MELMDAEIWLAQVVKGGLADKETIKAIKTVLAELEKQKQVKAEMRKVAWEEGYNQGYLAGAMESI